MVTPSSSVTSASPPTTYLQPHSPSLSTDMDIMEREEREKAIQKFMASAELSVVARGLRARLSYASYKAIHNIPHIPLNDLEGKTKAVSFAPPRLIGTKRKATGGNNYYNNPATQSTPSRRDGINHPPVSSGSSSAAAARSHYPTGAPGSSSNATQSLFTALLGPPPLKQARTVHNSSDPPVQAASRSTAGSRARQGSRGEAAAIRSIAEGTRAQSRNRKEEATRPKGRRGDKGKQRESAEEAADVERQAVATLTSLLQSRPSMASVSSPRSTLSTGSDSGSFQSLSHYVQSSARTTTAPSSLMPSAESSFSASNQVRASTPPRPGAGDVHSTPRADDEEAANLMLYLHTSPSPARPTTTRDKGARDLAAFRTLGGGSSLRAKGRVLFSGGEDGRSPLRSESSFTVDSLPGSQSSQTLSQPLRLETSNNGAGSLAPSAPMEPIVIPPTPVAHAPPHSSHLLPAPPSPPRRADSSSLPVPPQAPPTPGNVPFNLNDFINVSPSPAAATVPRSAISLKSGLGANLRADVGRKLFEEEHNRHQHMSPSSTTGAYTDGLRNERGGGVLGASIDLATS
ncbi:hypothetical protein HYDPIDRAFT_93792 [Hydnomerulius pinastri MD-312]|uniref:Uncharacterized protein n=1 Tax=Hydnomerulius pinastri MD-312 TaxID=994086 RepID=A0A0C9VX87_9AGAM|nr:hypothetical protein HYDPIDRAFT_93792 [Hydnomerulius pinastri MD-312]